MGKSNKSTVNNGSPKGEGFIKSLISGSLFSERIILGNLPLIFMLTVLGAFYIGNRFHAEKIIRKTDVLLEEVKELRAEAMATASELMFLSKQSQVINQVKQRGLELEEMKEPPFKLVVKQ
ncbi:MAG: FtsL-like putative cell division protein [Bacteroidales bacterium]|nr:FtsL-like putative cell division protein [Bacteroidales bacterium]